MSKSTIAELFWEFAKVGLFTFGGGYAMIPIIENLCLEKKHWLNAEEMAHTIAIAEATPGPIAINCATFVGFRQARWLGALSSTVGICLPSFVIIYIIALFLHNFLEIQVIAHAFAGIKVAVGLLILQAGCRMARRLPASWLNYSLTALACAALLAGELDGRRISAVYILAGAVLLTLLHCLATGGPSLAGADDSGSAGDSGSGSAGAGDSGSAGDSDSGSADAGGSGSADAGGSGSASVAVACPASGSRAEQKPAATESIQSGDKR